MKQMKIRRKKNSFLIEMNFGKTQTVNEREADAILREHDGNFLMFDIAENKKGFTIVYDAGGLLTVPELLKMSVLSKRMFIYILRQFVHIDKKLEENHFSKDLAVFDIENVFIDPASWHIYIMYVPVQPFMAGGSFREVLQGMISYASFDQSSKLDYVSEFISLINDEFSFSRFMIEDYVKKHGENTQNDTEIQRRCAKCGYLLKKEDTECPMCGEVSPFDANKIYREFSSSRYDGEKDFGKKEKDAYAIFKKTEKLSVNKDQNGIITAFKAPESSERPYLVKFETRISIDKFPFRIGKQNDMVDFCIRNGAVSRKHADIIKEQGRYYIVDLASTNGTFLNGRRLQSGLKEEIKSGALVKFANETYMFSVEKEK